jgi:hypothetical protein
MKNISTGTGIALLAGAIVAYPIIDRVMPRADAGATHVAAVAAATAQVPPEPTIVWYGAPAGGGTNSGAIYRAWSDGRIEVKFWERACCGGACDSLYQNLCIMPWRVLNDPAEGLTYRSDINFDSKVDGADLSQVLNDWGNAPRQDISPSPCPLNLINP